MCYWRTSAIIGKLDLWFWSSALNFKPWAPLVKHFYECLILSNLQSSLGFIYSPNGKWFQPNLTWCAIVIRICIFRLPRGAYNITCMRFVNCILRKYGWPCSETSGSLSVMLISNCVSVFRVLEFEQVCKFGALSLWCQSPEPGSWHFRRRSAMAASIFLWVQVSF